MIDAIDRELIVEVQQGLPLTPRPYASIAKELDISEREVISRLARLKQHGLIKRLGVVVRHRKLGYKANAMVVWDIPDDRVDEIGAELSRIKFINLCYQRPRREQWPYNLYCMIHGKSRETVLQQLGALIENLELYSFEHEVLFSRRCFKQRGARYG